MNESNVFNQKKKKLKSYVYLNKEFTNEELLSQIEELNSKRTLQNLDHRLVFEVYSSNRIEGNKLSRIDTKLLIEKKIIPEDSSYSDILECINLNSALHDFRLIDEIDLDLVLMIHRTITNGLLKPSEKGKLRIEKVFITNSSHRPPNPELVEKMIRDAIEKFNNSKRSLVDVFMFKLDLVTIHPFIDGNGRTSRLIMNGLLEKLGYPRLIVTEDNENAYYDALEKTNERFDKNIWVRFCLIWMKYTLEHLDYPLV